MRTWCAVILMMSAMVVAMRSAEAGWYYGWSCAGACAPNDVAIRGTEGPYGSEGECDSAKSADSYHHDLMLASGNFGSFESCYEEGGSSSSSSGPSYGGSGRANSPMELRVFAGVRMFSFGSDIVTDQTQAGQTADDIKANARIKPGALVVIQADLPRWSGGFFELSYYRSTLESRGTDLGVLSGGWFAFGYQRGKLIGQSRCGVQLQLGLGIVIGGYTPSDANTEAKAQDDSTIVSFIGSSRLGLSCKLTSGGTWLDLGIGAQYLPQEFAETGDLLDPGDKLWLRTQSASTFGGIGLTFAP